MEIFQTAFNKSRNKNIRTRTFQNLDNGLNSDYLLFYNTAIDDFNRNNLDAALGNINETIKKSDIDDWKHFAFKGNVLEDLKRYVEAIEQYETSIEFAKADQDVYAQYHQIGFCYYCLLNYKKAVEFYTYAIQLKINRTNSEYNQDQEGMDMGILRGIPFKRMYNNRADAYLNLDHIDESFNDCKISLDYDNTYSNPYLVISQLYAKIGQDNKAIEFLRISAQLGNKNAMQILKQNGL